jgi:hypothetical protein
MITSPEDDFGTVRQSSDGGQTSGQTNALWTGKAESGPRACEQPSGRRQSMLIGVRQQQEKN